jgi:hypothetical protein
MNTTDAPKTDFGTCGCGRPAEKISSGSPECWRCWGWRKHKGTETRFWRLGIDTLFQNKFGTGPDMNDITQWERWGVVDEMVAALWSLRKLHGLYVEREDAHKRYLSGEKGEQRPIEKCETCWSFHPVGEHHKEEAE